jgi:hypothetical protein
MRTKSLSSPASVCQLCDFVAFRHSIRQRSLYQLPKYTGHSRSFTTTKKILVQSARTPAKQSQTSSQSTQAQPLPARHNASKAQTSVGDGSQGHIENDMREVMEKRDQILTNARIPSEQEIDQALAQCKTIADALVEPSDPLGATKDGSAASALLSVDEPTSTKPASKSQKFSLATQKHVDQLSSIAHSILLHPTVFITPNILRQYVSLQARLRKPETFPEIFNLYSSKPIPEAGSSPIKYMKQNPNKVANAVPGPVADQALQTAIETKQLVVAMDIIESSYATTAFRRAKFVRKGLLPVTGLAVAPVAAYAVAAQLATYQTTMDPTTATNMAFAGIIAYVGFTATIGIVAVTTANDQMDRVTWAQGMPLRERWIREEERAAIDRIAGAWGFRQKWRRGEEEGEEWDALREWIGRKGMMLDRVELMEGME